MVGDLERRLHLAALVPWDLDLEESLLLSELSSKETAGMSPIVGQESSTFWIPPKANLQPFSELLQTQGCTEPPAAWSPTKEGGWGTHSFQAVASGLGSPANGLGDLLCWKVSWLGGEGAGRVLWTETLGLGGTERK